MNELKVCVLAKNDAIGYNNDFFYDERQKEEVEDGASKITIS